MPALALFAVIYLSAGGSHFPAEIGIVSTEGENLLNYAL